MLFVLIAFGVCFLIIIRTIIISIIKRIVIMICIPRLEVDQCNIPVFVHLWEFDVESMGNLIHEYNGIYRDGKDDGHGGVCEECPHTKRNVLMYVCENYIDIPGRDIRYYNDEIMLFKFDDMFFTLLTKCSTDVLQLLMNHRGYFGINCFRFACRARKYHYALALLNYGFKFDSDDISRTYITSDQFRSFLMSERLSKILNDGGSGESSSGSSDGHRLMLLDQTCPITMEVAENPAIIEDGYIYELDYIVKHLKSSSSSPMTNQTLKCHSIYCILENKFVYV